MLIVRGVVDIHYILIVGRKHACVKLKTQGKENPVRLLRTGFRLLFECCGVQFVLGKPGVFRNLFGSVFQSDALCFQCQHLCHGILQRNDSLLTGFCACHHQNKLTLGGIFRVVSHRLPQRAAPSFLMELGQFPTQSNASLRAKGLA